MKKLFDEPMIELIGFSVGDVIATSEDEELVGKFMGDTCIS